ncbi:MAG: hypothetical protein WCD24_00060, partial [Serratia inhibens]|uniref:hypothetical protein n=1 Tax=Serratia inhibens TaxID=2338073 RepID=UPI003C7BCCF5
TGVWLQAPSASAASKIRILMLPPAIKSAGIIDNNYHLHIDIPPPRDTANYFLVYDTRSYIDFIKYYGYNQ